MTSPARAEVVLVSRVLPAPPAEVFDWLTDPAKLARWMSPQGEVVAQADARVGGRLHIVMVGDGTRIEHRGEYLEVSPPERLVFTWNSVYTDGDSLVTIDLQEQAGGTLLTLRHERLPLDHADAHLGGWTKILERLALEIRHAGEA